MAALGLAYNERKMQINFFVQTGASCKQTWLFVNRVRCKRDQVYFRHKKAQLESIAFHNMVSQLTALHIDPNKLCSRQRFGADDPE